MLRDAAVDRQGFPGFGGHRMKIDIPVEVLDEKCKLCSELDVDQQWTDIWDGHQIVAREFHSQCSHLALCKRLKGRFEKHDD